MTADVTAPAVAGTQPDSDRQRAEAMYLDALARGESVSGAELARRFDRPDRWGRRVIDRVRADRPHPETSTNGAKSGATDIEPVTPPPVKRTSARTPSRSRKADTGQVPVTFVVVTAVAVALVAVVCAVASYVHLRDLGRTAGLGSLASWLPLGVDGLAAAATCSLLVDRHRGRPGEPLAKLGVLLGIVGSVAGNIVAVDPELVDVRTVRLVLAAYPPLALGVSAHLLVRMVLGDHRTEPK